MSIKNNLQKLSLGNEGKFIKFDKKLEVKFHIWNIY